jgi:hypothetical protein
MAMDDLAVKMARTIFAHHGELWIPKQLAADISMLANRMREGDKVTAAEVEVVMAELEASPGFSEWEAKELSAQAAPAKLKTACLVFAWLLA